MAKRRLTDLYVVGKEVTFDDGAGDPITVYVKKLTPVDHETALRNANAARSRLAAQRNDPESEERHAVLAAIEEFDDEGLIEYLVEDKRTHRQPIIEAQTTEEDEWSKDSYLQGLLDAWNDGLDRTYAENPEDPEAARVFDEMQRFNKVVDDILEAELDDFRMDLETRARADLEELVFDKLFTMQLSIRWLHEYRRSEIYLATREQDKKTRHFERRDEVDELPGEVFRVLSETLQNLVVDPTEGKGSPATGASSPSSEQPAAQAADSFSGPTAATA